MDENPKTPIIKNIVISGGAVWGFSAYGVIKHACQQKYIDLKNIKSYYGTSVGTMLSVLFALDYDFDIMDDFLIKRPWYTIFEKGLLSLMESYEKMGLYSIESMKQIFMPLFKGKDIDIDITLREFYEKNNIDIYFYTIDVNDYKIVEVCHKTHPDWKVIEAVYASSAVPIAFQPLIKDNKFYCDGAFINNFPLYNCMQNEDDHDSIFSINLYGPQDNINNINVNSTLFEYVFHIISNCVSNITNENNKCNIKNKITIQKQNITINDLFLSFSNCEKRQLLIQLGIDQMDEFLQSLDTNPTTTLYT
jgi:NTE family protein